MLTNFSDKKSHLLIKFDNPISLKKNKEYSIKVVNYYKGSYYLQTNGVKEGLNDSNIFTIKECSSETRFITDNRNTTNNQYPPQFKSKHFRPFPFSYNEYSVTTASTNSGILIEIENSCSPMFFNSSSISLLNSVDGLFIE